MWLASDLIRVVGWLQTFEIHVSTIARYTARERETPDCFFLHEIRSYMV